MNNEIGRKLTSLTLMTIMFAGGLTFAIPGAMPEAHAANANLFVSAENSQFQNYFAGPMVVEVVINDPDIDDTDQGKGEPDVKVNGKKIRMVQNTDGKWYAYFADRAQAQTADQIALDSTGGAKSGLVSVGAGNSTDFGMFCSSSSGLATVGFALTDTVGFAVARNATGASDGTSTIGTCTGVGVYTTAPNGAATPTPILINNVVRENKTVNTNPAITPGQVGFQNSGQFWPVIQLYDFSAGGNVVVTYNKGGNPQTTTLTFDTVDQFAKLDLDRTKYPRGAEVHATITDIQLNIDPTDEDSWTFGTLGTNSTILYQLFNENGGRAGDGHYTKAGLIAGNRTALMFEDNGLLKLTVTGQGGARILDLEDNEDQQLSETNGPTTFGSINAASQPVTFTEIGSNTGIFGNYDELDDSNLDITSNAARGQTAVIDYNNKGKSILVGFEFAKIDIQSPTGEWNSGEETPVTLIAPNQNLNSRADEDLDVNNAGNKIPALQTGTPFSIADSTGGNKTQALFLGRDVDRLAATPAGFTPLRSAVGDNFGNITAFTDNQIHSKRAILSPVFATGVTVAQASALIIDPEVTMKTVKSAINNPQGNANNQGRFTGLNLLNLDVRGINSTLTTVDVYFLNSSSTTPILAGTLGTNVTANIGSTTAISLANATNVQSLVSLNVTETTIANLFKIADTNNIGFLIDFPIVNMTSAQKPIVLDLFSFGFKNSGLSSSERVANQIVRFELEETGDNTSTFVGTLEFRMVNQLNILDPATYTGLDVIDDEPQFIVIEDLTDEDSPRINFNDIGGDGVPTSTADQQAAPSHSGVVSFDASSYKIADTVTVTLEDQDLNTDVDTIDIYTVVSTPGDAAKDAVGKSNQPTLSFGNLGRLLDITFDDARWTTPTAGSNCEVALTPDVGADTGLIGTGFTLIETGPATGIFTGDFEIPSKFCTSDTASPTTTTGKDIEVNYVDFRDASGEIIEVGDGAGVRANTGSVSLDRTVYPVPWGVPSDFTQTTDTETPSGRSVFPVHAAALNRATDTNTVLNDGEFLSDGDLTIHVRVNDPDFDTSGTGTSTIAQSVAGQPGVGPIKVSVLRGAQSVVLGYAGGPVANLTGVLDVGDVNENKNTTRQFGPLQEISPTAGIFELDLDIRYTDGPASSTCPDTATNGYVSTSTGDRGAFSVRFNTAPAAGTDYCILQGDILQVEYTDPEDASGNQNTVTDSATFDLRNGVLQSDKSVYIIGSDMILTLIEPDFDLDNDQAETYDLDLIEWDSDAATISMGNLGDTAGKFDPEPSDFRETGDSTGIFQIVIEIPDSLAGDKLERGEEIVLEYTDWGPSGSDYVGDEDEDVNLTIFTSNFGATVELDQKVYSWTDKVYITIVAPDHNFDSNLVDQIGDSTEDPIKVATRGKKLNSYKLVETGTDTGIFTGEVILTGFQHDADGDVNTGAATTGSDTNPRTTPASGGGPTNGFLETSDNDGLTVSFEFSEDETVVGSALIRWNIGEVQWLEASYPAKGTGVVRVVDPDMNLNPEAVDNFKVDVWSDSDAGGIDLTVTETNEATGIFEGTVFFTVSDESSGHRLRVSEGDTITAEYEDNTLPSPYTRADELDITGTAIIGTIVPPLERAPASNARVVDAFGNSLASVSVDQQVQITADLANGQDRAQAFAYLVQVQDGNGVTVSLAWITGSLSPGQSFSPALSWIPSASGSYKATIFVWESVDNPTALSPPVSVSITVN